MSVKEEVVEGLIGKCMESFNVEKWHDAVACLEEITRDYPKLPGAWFLKGTCLSKMEKFGEALECFERAVQLNPKDLASHYAKGLCLIRLKRLDEAVASFEKCVELDKENVEALFQLWVAHVFKGNLVKAFPYFAKARAINPKLALSNYRTFFEGVILPSKEFSQEDKMKLEKMIEELEKTA